MARIRRPKMEPISLLWNSPRFKGYDGFQAAIQDLEDAEFGRPSVGNVEDNRHLAVIGKDTGEIFGYVKGRYRIVQDREVFGALLDSLKNDQVEISGTFYRENGETKLYLCLGEAMHLRDSSYRYMIIARNSYNGEVAWSAMSALMRQICSNGLMGVKGVCGRFYQKHIIPFGDMVNNWGSFVERTAEDAPRLSEIIDAKSAEIVPNLEMVLRGAGFGPQIAGQVVTNFDKLVPEARGRQMTVWDAYNGVTNLYSNRGKGNWATNAEGLEMASRMLETPLETLILRGREALTVTATP